MAAVADNRGIRLKQRLSRIAVIISITLLGLSCGLGASHTAAILSDTLNSLLDVFSYTVAFMRIKIRTHPFGHRHAEPLAACSSPL